VPLRLAICGDGRSPHTQRWANAFAQRGHGVTVVWRRDQFAGADLSPYDASIRHEAVGGDFDPRRPWQQFVAWRKARNLARELRPDIVHGLYLQQHGWTAHDFGVQPLVLSALGSDVMGMEDALPDGLRAHAVGRYIRARTRAALRAAEVVLCDSTDVASRVESLVPGVKTDLVRFGVDPPAADGGDWRERLAIARNAFVVLSTRLFKSNYNIDVIIEAMPHVLRDVPEAVLVLKEYEPFSDPSYRERCLALIDRLGIGSAVRLVGELPPAELRELYAASDVYVSVPSTDGTAVSIFEAMASRIPIVASRAKGIDPAVLNDGYSARLVEPGSSDDLSRVLVALARDDEARGALVEQAYVVYEMLGSASSQFDRAERIYRDLLARLGRSA